MNIHFAPEHHERRVRIKVIGVGGAGGNAVNRMVEAGLSEVDFYAVNTDGQALDTSRAHQTLVIGDELTRGLGAGGDPTLGRRAAEEDRALLAGMVEDADMVFVTAGMGGGTGTGAAPVVAQVARESGALTVAVVTRPFLFEGRRRAEQAEGGLEALRDHVDAMLVIPNERLMEIEVADIAMSEVFRVADNVLYEATRGISDIISQHAVVNLDFADVRTVMKDSGAAIMGTGRAAGQDRAAQAAEVAINSPLLENVDIAGSRAVLVYLTAGEVTRNDLAGAMNLVRDAAGTDAHIFFGFGNDQSLGDELLVTVIATGFPGAHGDQVARRPATVATAAPELVQVPEAAPAVEVVPEPVVEPIAEAAQDPVPVDVEVDAEVMTSEAAVADSEPEVSLAAEQVVEPEPVAEPASALAALAAAAGGGARDVPTAAPSATSQRFLEPMGTVKLSGTDQADAATETNQRFRRSVLSQDKSRPAWERKYVD
jgi:cell division protein FtsZ